MGVVTPFLIAGIVVAITVGSLWLNWRCEQALGARAVYRAWLAQYKGDEAAMLAAALARYSRAEEANLRRRHFRIITGGGRASKGAA